MSDLERLMMPVQPDISIIHINLLSEQLDVRYQLMREERSAIAHWEEGQEFSILGVLELFATEIQGYAEQIKLARLVDPIAQSVDHLSHLNVFRIDYFANWYFNNWQQYPQTKQYVEELDHLRLLLLEYLNQLLAIAA